MDLVENVNWVSILEETIQNTKNNTKIGNWQNYLLVWQSKEESINIHNIIFI